MKIDRIRIFQTALPYAGGTYAWGAGNSIEVACATVVVIDTDAGLSECGEFTPCGENYMVAFSAGVPALASLVAPHLLGQDPRDVAGIERLLDSLVQGHGYAKAPFDAACWDILAQSLDAPLWRIWGGRLTEGAPLYRVVPQNSPEAVVEEMQCYRDQGYRHFQIKVGGDWIGDIKRIRTTVPLLRPEETVMADANQGWRVDDALRVARVTRDLNYILEQPCRTYAECLQVRSRTDLPVKLDECVTGMEMAQRIVADRSADICCLKISNLGGLSKARRVRDYLVENRIPIVAEDTWDGEVASSALAHFAVTTPAEYLYNTTDPMSYNTRSTGIGGPKIRDGRLFAPDLPGLGTLPNFESLGDPVATYGVRE